MNRKVAQEFVFGYGSLICPISRAITAPSLARKTVTPVVVKNVERIWAKRVQGVMTAMGVRFKDDAQCVGVLLPVENWELKRFDQREYGYDRVPLYLGDVETVPFLGRWQYTGKGHQTFLRGKARKHPIKVWMYLQQESTPPSGDAPILQSYVDTILRGCLSISEDFAQDFLVHTKGWTTNDEVDNLSDINAISIETVNSLNAYDAEVLKEQVHWVNDRNEPIYRRGDQHYMLKNSQMLDDLLKKHRNEFKYRIIDQSSALK